MDMASFLGVKWPGRDTGKTHPPSWAKVKESVELYLYSPSGPLWPVTGQNFYDTYGRNNCNKNNEITQHMKLRIQFIY
jgi:hypothetical protein